eukprot:88621-Prymnesium_polylepis.1
MAHCPVAAQMLGSEEIGTACKLDWEVILAPPPEPRPPRAKRPDVRVRPPCSRRAPRSPCLAPR